MIAATDVSGFTDLAQAAYINFGKVPPDNLFKDRISVTHLFMQESSQKSAQRNFASTGEWWTMLSRATGTPLGASSVRQYSRRAG